MGLLDLAKQERLEAMTNNDFFLVNGCSVTDEAHAFDFILGNYSLFAFDHHKVTFSKVEY